MTITQLKTLLGAATIAASFVGGAAVANADSLEAIMQVGKERTAEARASQTKIDRLADETRDLLADYKTVMKQVEGLRVYNARLDRQIANQERRIADIDQSISDAAVIQRQIPPLVTRMLDGLDQFNMGAALSRTPIPSKLMVPRVKWICSALGVLRWLLKPQTVRKRLRGTTRLMTGRRSRQQTIQRRFAKPFASPKNRRLSNC